MIIMLFPKGDQIEINSFQSSTYNSYLFLKILEDLQTVMTLGTVIDGIDVHFKSNLMGLMSLISENNISENNIREKCQNLLQLSKSLRWMSTSSLLNAYQNSFHQSNNDQEFSIKNKDQLSSNNPIKSISSNLDKHYSKQSIKNDRVQTIVDLLLESKSCPFPLNDISNSPYSSNVRLRKILKYKIRKILKGNSKPISRKFQGRSKAAQKKLRHKGRFIKKGTIVKKNMFKILRSNSN